MKIRASVTILLAIILPLLGGCDLFTGGGEDTGGDSGKKTITTTTTIPSGSEAPQGEESSQERLDNINARLAEIEIGNAAGVDTTLSPGFDPNIFQYVLYLDNSLYDSTQAASLTEVKLTAAAQVAAAELSYYLDGTKQENGAFGVTDDTKEIVIKVTAKDTRVNKTYTIRVGRYFHGAADTIAEMGTFLPLTALGDTPDAPYPVKLGYNDPFSVGDLYDILDGLDPKRYIDLDLGGNTVIFTGNAISYDGRPGAEYITSLILPDSVTTIDDGAAAGTGAFSGYKELKTITMRGVNTIGNYAFDIGAGAKLESIIVGGALTDMFGDEVFGDPPIPDTQVKIKAPKDKVEGYKTDFPTYEDYFIAE
jgi:hypothetical protein